MTPPFLQTKLETQTETPGTQEEAARAAYSNLLTEYLHTTLGITPAIATMATGQSRDAVKKADASRPGDLLLAKVPDHGKEATKSSAQKQLEQIVAENYKARTLDPDALIRLGIAESNGKFLSELSKYVTERMSAATATEPHAKPTFPLKLNSGYFEIYDSHNNKHLIHPAGMNITQYADGRTRMAMMSGDRVTSEIYAGTRPEQNFQIQYEPGKPPIVIEIPAATRTYLDDATVKKERDALDTIAAQKITDPCELAQFRADIARLEDRSKEMELRYKKSGTDEAAAHSKALDQVTGTYRQLQRLFSAKDEDLKVPADYKTLLVEQILAHAATPTSTDQGKHMTCNVTDPIEVRTYERLPAVAAKVVVDAALSGQYTASDGRTVTLRASGLVPHGEAKEPHPKDGHNDFSDQLFQIVAVNVGHLDDGSTYTQTDGSSPWDTGEWLISKDGKQVTGYEPRLSCDQIITAGNLMTGEKRTDWLAIDSKFDQCKLGVKVESETALGRILQAGKENGLMPMTICVYTGNQPFITDSSGGRSAGFGEWHVINVFDYDAGPPPMVAVDNSWGSKADHLKPDTRMSLHDLYHSMRAHPFEGLSQSEWTELMGEAAILYVGFKGTEAAMRAAKKMIFNNAPSRDGAKPQPGAPEHADPSLRELKRGRAIIRRPTELSRHLGVQANSDGTFTTTIEIPGNYKVGVDLKQDAQMVDNAKKALNDRVAALEKREANLNEKEATELAVGRQMQKLLSTEATQAGAQRALLEGCQKEAANARLNAGERGTGARMGRYIIIGAIVAAAIAAYASYNSPEPPKQRPDNPAPLHGR